MGVVYRAVDELNARIVALKVLSENNSNAAARFGHEARALSQLSHPNIVQYISHGLMLGGEPYLVMEWLEGESLSARLRASAS